MKIYGRMKLRDRISYKADSIIQWIWDIDWFIVGLGSLMVAALIGLAICTSIAITQIARLG
jgi:hypothetical protein